MSTSKKEKKAASGLISESFNLEFNARGITSLKRVNDAFDTDYIREDMNLGDVMIAYRKEGGEWIKTSTVDLSEKASPVITEKTCTLACACNEDLEVTVTYTLDGNSLLWSLQCANCSESPVEIGDIGLSFPFNTHYTWDKETTLTKRVLRHSYVSGHGSFMFWLRCNSVGPYLVMTPQKGTHLEYYDIIETDNRRHDYNAFIHSTVTGTETVEKGGNWRQPFTSVTLAPKGEENDTVSYGFEFCWADGYDAIRQVLVDKGCFDIEVIPGMVIPTDLSAQFSLRTTNMIDAVEAEFPDQTDITYIGEKQKDVHVYTVTFTRLGENMLTVRYNGDQHMYLEFFVTEPVETLIKKRSAFLVNTHQHRDPDKWYNGVYADWNMDNQVLLSPDNKDRIIGWREYMVTCDDPALGKAPMVAAKNVNFPDEKEIESLEYYIDNFVWGGLQRTEEELFPYGIYGIPHWKKNRESDDVGPRGNLHIWRIYDYPHITLLYYLMYKIAKFFPELPMKHSKEEYLRRAFGTARAFFTIPLEITEWTAYKTGTYNELIINSLINELHELEWKEEAECLRIHWERKISNFVGDEVNPFGSEYAFDSTGFESTHAFAKYALEHCIPDDADERKARFKIKRKAAEAFMEMQTEYNLFCRGWLETSYYHYGSDYRGESSRYTLSYMAQMGGWSILDYGLYYAENPFPYLRLGYASYLSSWALMNTGTPESNYGYWYPGKENDGAAGGGFEPAPYAKTWLDQEQGRGSWYYSCEIDLGFNGGLRMAATVVADDPIFGLNAMGGDLQKTDTGVKVIPKDGLQRRFHMVTDSRRLHLLLKRDGFLAKPGIDVADDLSSISFQVENRWPHYHETEIVIEGLPKGKYRVTVAGTGLTMLDIKEGEKTTVMIPVNGEHFSRKIEIIRWEK
jgi:hypothetical protein